MPALTRRRYPEHTDCWHVYYADVHIGTIVRRVGCPHDEDPWEWSCGFYPGSRPGEHQAGKHGGQNVEAERKMDFLT